MLFLIGGGKCLAMASIKTRMTTMVGDSLTFLNDLDKYLVLCFTTAVMGILTQFASNMTAVNMMIPILTELAVHLKTHPGFLCHPAAYMASLAFMLPMGTTSNVVAAGYANLHAKHFLKGGTLVLIISYVVLLLAFVSYGRLLWGEMQYPDWAE